MAIKNILKAEKAKALSAFVEMYKASGYEKTLPEDMKALPGEELILAGYIGQAGTLYLKDHCFDQLKKGLPEHFIRSADCFLETVTRYPDWGMLKSHGATAAIPVGEGGIYQALCSLAGLAKKGFRVDYEAVPIKQVTVEFCNECDLDPWKLFSCGCVLVVSERGYETLRALEQAGFACAGVGYLTEDNDKLICHEEVASCLNRPEADELLKVMGDQAWAAL